MQRPTAGVAGDGAVAGVAGGVGSERMMVGGARGGTQLRGAAGGVWEGGRGRRAWQWKRSGSHGPMMPEMLHGCAGSLGFAAAAAAAPVVVERGLCCLAAQPRVHARCCRAGCAHAGWRE
eukprot:1156499-Pelagomonas_calceolata.AAC.1